MHEPESASLYATYATASLFALVILFADLSVAVVLDMEGQAPAGGDTSELVTDPPDYGVSYQGSFKIIAAHGHYWSATHTNVFAQSDIGGTASDWFLHDSDTPLRIEEVSGAAFSITSFQAGEWLGWPAPSTTGNPIHVIGYPVGGGTVSTTFITDATPSDGVDPNVDFETFVFPPGWDAVTAVEFYTDPPNDDDRQMGYDNIVIDLLPPPPPCACDGDLDASGTVTPLDFSAVSVCIGATPPDAADPCYVADVDCSGTVDASDEAVVACQLGSAPDPACCDCSALAAAAVARPTFSFDSHGYQAQITAGPTWPFGGTFFNAGTQILTTAVGGPSGPNPPSPVDTPYAPGISLDQTALGLMMIGYIDIDALSFGTDEALTCDRFGASLQFSVDEFADGAAGTAVGLLGGMGAQEVAADTIRYAAPIAPTPLGSALPTALVLDGSRLGLVEPFHPPSAPGGDNLDAYHRDTTPADLAGPIYFSMDASVPDPFNSYVGGAAFEGFVGGDVLVSMGGVVSLAIPAATLGLDLGGADTDDLDALVFDDADTSGNYSAGDTLLFSVRRGSSVIGVPDSLFGLGIEPGDVLSPPTGAGLPPAIFIPAERLGLLTTRTDAVAYGDELDALDAAFVPEPGGALSVGAVALLALRALRRRRAK